MKNRKLKSINEIIVHCSATPPDRDIGAAEIRNWHVRAPNHWDDIGYHFVIRRNGKIEPGRTLDFVGAHCRGHNSRSVGVCLVGGTKLNEHPKPDASFTMDQYQALLALIRMIQVVVPGTVKVSGHRDYSSKACPSFDVAALLAKLPRPRRPPRE